MRDQRTASHAQAGGDDRTAARRITVTAAPRVRRLCRSEERPASLGKVNSESAKVNSGVNIRVFRKDFCKTARLLSARPTVQIRPGTPISSMFMRVSLSPALCYTLPNAPFLPQKLTQS